MSAPFVHGIVVAKAMRAIVIRWRGDRARADLRACILAVKWSCLEIERKAVHAVNP